MSQATSNCWDGHWDKMPVQTSAGMMWMAQMMAGVMVPKKDAQAVMKRIDSGSVDGSEDMLGVIEA